MFYLFCRYVVFNLFTQIVVHPGVSINQDIIKIKATFDDQF